MNAVLFAIGIGAWTCIGLYYLARAFYARRWQREASAPEPLPSEVEELVAEFRKLDLWSNIGESPFHVIARRVLADRETAVATSFDAGRKQGRGEIIVSVFDPFLEAGGEK